MKSETHDLVSAKEAKRQLKATLKIIQKDLLKMQHDYLVKKAKEWIQFKNN